MNAGFSALISPEENRGKNHSLVRNELHFSVYLFLTNLLKLLGKLSRNFKFLKNLVLLCYFPERNYPLKSPPIRKIFSIELRNINRFSISICINLYMQTYIYSFFVCSMLSFENPIILLRLTFLFHGGCWRTSS